jgi:hypothetical protein
LVVLLETSNQTEHQNIFRKTMNILTEAQQIINGDRRNDYGHPLDNFTNIAAGWAVILGTEVTPEQVALCMAWSKIARQTHRPKRDNLVDACGYLGNIEMIEQRRGESVE